MNSVFHFLVPCLILGCPIKEEIALFQQQLISVPSNREKAQAHYQMAILNARDQELDKAFTHFLYALKMVPLQESHSLEDCTFQAAFSDYLTGAIREPKEVALELIKKYAGIESPPLSFLLATAYANLENYELFFDLFYQGFPLYGESYLAHKTRGIIYLRLSQHALTFEERQALKKEAAYYLTKALEKNVPDASLYKLLIFLAKDEKKDSLILTYLQKMVEEKVVMARGDICFYIEEAVRLGDSDLGQRMIALARSQYTMSRAIELAQEFLNQNRE